PPPGPSRRGRRGTAAALVRTARRPPSAPHALDRTVCLNRASVDSPVVFPSPLRGPSRVTSPVDRLGWSRLAHPRPAPRGRRPPEPPDADRPGTAGRVAVDDPHALVVGVALLSDRRGPRRPRGVRHPRDG